jgi:amino-acid N-acetyltransferase
VNAPAFTVRTAHIADAPGIHALLTNYSDQELLLPRPESEIISLIPQFFVIEHNQQIIACVSIEIFSNELAEVRSLAVDPTYKNQKLGAKLLSRVEDYARQLGLTKMMALTYVEGFFHKYGYETVEMTSLPEKVWRVCVKCPRFHHCDEIPVLKQL